MRPIIHICPRFDGETYTVNKDYINAIYHSGGQPLIMSYNEVDLPDGLLITGGDDIQPQLYNEPPDPRTTGVNPARDEFEIKLIKRALQAGIPLLCICRGHQVLNVALGGSMIQHVDGHSVKEHQAHKVTIAEDSLLFDIVKQKEIMVNSRHHQVVNRLGNGLKAVAAAGEYNEAIQVVGQPFALGIQWHPETIFYDENSKAIFKRFVEAATKA